MREKGIVARISEGKAAIRMSEGAACSKCGLCSVVGGGHREIVVDAPPGLEPGDAVDILVEPRARLMAAGLVFCVPLIAFVAAILAGEYSLWTRVYRDPLSLLAGIAAAACAFASVARYDRKLRARGIELIQVEKIA